MGSALLRRLTRLEDARMGIESLSDEDLHCALYLLAAKLSGRRLTAAEESELARMQSSYRSDPSPIGDVDPAAVDRQLKTLGYSGLPELS